MSFNDQFQSRQKIMTMFGGHELYSKPQEIMQQVLQVLSQLEGTVSGGQDSN